MTSRHSAQPVQQADAPDVTGKHKSCTMATANSNEVESSMTGDTASTSNVDKSTNHADNAHKQKIVSVTDLNTIRTGPANIRGEKRIRLSTPCDIN